MEDRSNIIKEAIEYRDKLEKKVKELAQSVVRLQVSLDFADNTIKKKDREIAELEAYKNVNEDFKTAWEELKAENKRLKLSERDLSRICQGFKKDIETQKSYSLKYYKVLQEIKAIAEKEYNKKLIEKDCCECDASFWLILDLITKAESEV